MPSQTRWWPETAWTSAQQLGLKADTAPAIERAQDAFSEIGATATKAASTAQQAVDTAGQVIQQAKQSLLPSLPDSRAFTRFWDDPSTPTASAAPKLTPTPGQTDSSSTGAASSGLSGPATGSRDANSQSGSPSRPADASALSTLGVPAPSKPSSLSSSIAELPPVKAFTRLWDTQKGASDQTDTPGSWSLNLPGSGREATAIATPGADADRTAAGREPSPTAAAAPVTSPSASSPQSMGSSSAPAAAPAGPAGPAGPPPAPNDWAGRARAAAVAAGHPNPDEFVEQMRQESQFDPDVISGKRASPAGAQGIAQIMPGVAKAAGIDPLNVDAALKYAATRMADNYRKYGDSAKALAEYNMGAGNLIKYGPTGLPETRTYIQKIQDATRAAIGAAAPQGSPATAPSAQSPLPMAPSESPSDRAPQPAGTPAWGTYTPESLSPNQITEGAQQGLSSQEALAVCGPAAAVAFARANGRNPTLGEAKELAQKTGAWDVNAGMHGPASEVQLLDKMGVPARLESGADWGKIAQEVQAGRPVIVDTPQHYFTVTGYDPQTGQFEFGASAGILRRAQGRTKFRPDEIASLGMGDPRATILMGAGAPQQGGQ